MTLNNILPGQPRVTLLLSRLISILIASFAHITLNNDIIGEDVTKTKKQGKARKIKKGIFAAGN